MTVRDCKTCRFCIQSINSIYDHRCNVQHVHHIVPWSAAYPTIEWMRGPGGVCGPDAALHSALKAREIAIEADDAYPVGQDSQER